MCNLEIELNNLVTHKSFIQKLEQKSSPYDIIGMEYQIGSHHSPDFENFKNIFDELIEFNKPVFIWEYWVLSADLDPKTESLYSLYIQNKPEGGWTEEYQASMFQQTLDYINANPLMKGMAQFGGSDNEVMEGYIIRPRGMTRSDGSKKPSYYVMQNWYNSLFTKCDLTTNEQGKVSFVGLPGRYKLSTGIFKTKIIDLNETTTIRLILN